MNRKIDRLCGQKSWRGGTLAALCMLCVLMLCVGVTGALAEAITGMEITAVIKAEGATNQALTGDGEFSVDFSKQFTLEIKVKSQLNLPGKKLEITVPEGLTVVEYPVPNPKQGDMAESVEFVKSTKSYGAYQPNNGTITYSLKDTATENSFNIILEPDLTLWNRRDESRLSDAEKKKILDAKQPLTVRAYRRQYEQRRDYPR